MKDITKLERTDITVFPFSQMPKAQYILLERHKQIVDSLKKQIAVLRTSKIMKLNVSKEQILKVIMKRKENCPYFISHKRTCKGCSAFEYNYCELEGVLKELSQNMNKAKDIKGCTRIEI